MTEPSLRLAHHHPGRLRLRSDALCAAHGARADERFRRVHEAISGLGGIHAVTHNASSGSIRVDYEPGAVDPNTLIDLVARAADLAPPPPEEEQQRRTASAASIVINTTRDLNAIAHELTGGRADLRDLVPMAMTGLAAYALVTRGASLPRWDNLAYWAFSIFSRFHDAEIAAGRNRAP